METDSPLGVVEADPRLHDLQDRLDDLGFAQATVDQLEATLASPHALDSASAPLTVIFRQLTCDLEAYAHGRMADQPPAAASAANQKTTIQGQIYAVLQAEGYPHRTAMSSGPAFLDRVDERILALDFLLGEVQAAKMIALAKHKAQQQQRTPAGSGNVASQLMGASATPQQQQANKKKRGGEPTSDSVDPDALAQDMKRLKSGQEASTVPMEDVPMESDVADDAASQELSDELHLLAHTLQVVLNQTTIDKQQAAAAGGTTQHQQQQLNGVTALRLLRSRIDSWLGASPVHAAAAKLAPLFQASEFSAKQLAVLADVYRTFSGDYSLRIRVLRKRLEVTLQSFMWGGKGKTCADQLARLAAAKLATFPPAALVDEYELWAATPQVLSIARMTSREYALRSSIKRVIIGRVPDRGGRVDTNTRIESEWGMPAFTKRTTTAEGAPTGGGHSHRGNRGGGGGGGGGHKGRGRGR